eukprot:GCRY01001065.1.p1 GENE.GCRY01001065.1~~GCRY01001065.1.p1  ORF type:complete len:230 (-),score=13.05 GCRY01001065.1:73-705(-)
MKCVGHLFVISFLLFGSSIAEEVSSQEEQWSVWLLNDDIHTFEEVYSAVQTTISCSHDDAVDRVNEAGTVGHSVLKYCEAQSECESYAAMLKEQGMDVEAVEPRGVPGKARVHAITTYYSKHGKESVVKHLLTKLQEYSRAESGCLAHTLLEDASDPTIFTVLAEWRSEQALNHHMQSGHAIAVSEKIEEYLDRRVPGCAVMRVHVPLAL